MYKGFYLNLASSSDRRDSLLRRLAEIGGESRYQRVEAVNGREIAHQYTTKLNPGELGLWLTHVNLVRSQQDSPHDLHIIEDDIMLIDDAVQVFDQLLVHAESDLPDWDVIYTDVGVALDSQLFLTLAAAMNRFRQNSSMTMLPLDGIQFAGTTSMFIRRQSLGKYMSLMDGGWDAQLPIDLFLQKLVAEKKIKAYLTLPNLTSPTPESQQSDIRGTRSPTLQVMDLFRRSFFKDADLKSISDQLQQLLSGVNIDPLSAVFLNATAFRFSDGWQGYK